MGLLEPAIGGGLVVLAAAAGWLWYARRRRGVVDGSSAGGPPATRPGAGIRAALGATRAKFRAQIEGALVGRSDPGDVYPALEEALVAADVGVRTAQDLLGRVRRRAGGEATGGDLREALRAELLDALGGGGAIEPTTRPWVVLVTGVNGVGKTTTIGKLAALHRAQGRSVLVVAADTFRAAAIDQLGRWAERAGASIVRHGPGADPGAVAYDGMKAAVARGADVVLVDTAGRLHTRSPLMEELRKVRRTIEREIPGAPHETLLVVDATTGQNAVSQARAFLEAAGVTGTVVTKLDGTARGGSLLAIRAELGLPVRYVGTGEAIEDLKPFDAAEFVAGLLEADV